MTERSFFLADPAQTDALAACVAACLRPGDAVLLSGVMGAGKSSFARAVLRSLSGDPALEVPSPTFTLVQTYDTPAGAVSHFDLWRMGDVSELEELGWDDACQGIVLVEWADYLGDLAPAGALMLDFALTAEGGRQARARWDGRLALLDASA